MARSTLGIVPLCAALVFLALPELSLAATAAGKVEELDGSVKAISTTGVRRSLEEGDPVFNGDRVMTERRASVKLRFVDKSRFDLGPDADMTVDNVVYDPKPERSSFTTRITKGAFRFVTGLVARFRPASMKVNLPVATIGIRGTHVVGQAEATSATIILLEPEGPDDKPTAVDVSNQFGAVVIDEPGYGTEVPDEHSPPSPVRRMQLNTINNLMRSFSAIQRISVPRPRIH